jgi:hypothetical protein
MTTAQEHNGIGKDLIVYVCLLALAGVQFVIAYQNIVLHASLDGEAWLSTVCCRVHDCRPAGIAIWVDRQLPDGDRRAIFALTYCVRGRIRG